MGHVGIERMLALVRTHPESNGWAWDPDLLRWLAEEDDRAEGIRRKPKPTKEHSRHDDYGMADS
ncbi:MAG: hypothetical protein FJW88_11555 [Actinobacteria bacterium]|nr:hypothetical protein [Actinomycetota bacterium]